MVVVVKTRDGWERRVGKAQVKVLWRTTPISQESLVVPAGDRVDIFNFPRADDVNA